MAEMTNEELKRMVLGTVNDLIANFLYYDRKGDEELTLKEIDRAFMGGIITVDEVVERFKSELIKHCPKDEDE